MKISAKNAFLLYYDQEDLFNALTDEEAGKLIKAIFQYEKGNEPQLDRMLTIAFVPIKQSLIRLRESYDKKASSNRENGKKGGRPKKEENPSKPKEPTGFLNNPIKHDSGNGNDSVPVSDTKLESDSNSPNSLTYLHNIPLQDLGDFEKKFQCTVGQITRKGKDLFDYCQSNGKRYEDHKALLRKALRKDFGERKVIVPTSPPEVYKEVSADVIHKFNEQWKTRRENIGRWDGGL